MNQVVYPKIGMVLDIPPKLKAWWRNLGETAQSKVRKKLGHLPLLMEVTACREIIEASVTFWDEEKVLFRFGENEITPLLEEIGGFIENVSLLWKGRHSWQSAGMIIPKNPSIKEFLEKFGFEKEIGLDNLKESKIPLDYLFDIFGCSDAFLRHREMFSSHASWSEKRVFVFSVCFFGLLVFPRGAKQEIYTRLVMVTDALFNGIDGKPYTIVPMVVADIYRALGLCKKGFKYFEGCNLLLQLWFMGHLQKINGSQELYKQNGANHIMSYAIPVVAFKHPNSVKGWGKLLSKLNDTTIQWMFSWYPSENFVIRGKILPYLVLIGL